MLLPIGPLKVNISYWTRRRIAENNKRLRKYLAKIDSGKIALISNGKLAQGLSFSRNSVASSYDVNGAIANYAIDAPRFQGANKRLLIEPAGRNLLLNSATLSTQSVAVSAQTYSLSFEGTGTVTLSGAASGSYSGNGLGYNNRKKVTFSASAGSLTLTVSGSVVFAQLEQAAFPSSWIPTTAAFADRSQDVCNYPVSAQGTLVATFLIPSVLGNRGLFSVHDGTTANRLLLRYDSNGALRLYRQIAGATTQSSFGPAISSGIVFRAAMGWDAGGVSAAVNGAVGQLTGLPPGLVTSGIGMTAVPSGEQVAGEIGDLDYYPMRLSNSKLQSLTGG